MNLHLIVKGVAGWWSADRKQGSRRSERRTALTLETLERRDVPSAAGLDPAQLQAGLYYLSQVAQQQTAILRQDMGVLVRDFQSGQTGRLDTDMQQLQKDVSTEMQTLTDAFEAVLSGNIPSSVSAPPSLSPKSSTATTPGDATLGGSANSSSSTPSRLISGGTSTSSTDTSLLDLLYQNYDPSAPSYDPFASSTIGWTSYNDWGIVSSGNQFDNAAGDLFGDSPLNDGYAGPGSYYEGPEPSSTYDGANG